ncbi:PTS sugar transporter subunit IIB [uncultured Dubosiella sp.]|uniref:PTS sugar transporter subunit IIB n=1 Tax=uncultured Dubosiella sp. TaxID=1937011 RepID=UPI002730DFA2|nr:PTS sugar transporter subunit IIB [uncultured Dubosiella sp.]
MKTIQSIVCCCGSGLGSSMMVSMNVEKVCKNLGLKGIRVDHTTVSEVNPNSADLVVVGKDLGYLFKDYPCTIVLDEILNINELTEKMKEKFEL